MATITKEVTTIRKKVATITKEVASIDIITNKLANRFLSQSFFKPKLLRAHFFSSFNKIAHELNLPNHNLTFP